MKALGRQALTVLLPVRAGREVALDAAVASLGSALAERLRAAESLHFARLVLVPGAPACLLFETTYDGGLAKHVAELFALAGAELGQVLAECDGVRGGGGFAEFEAALRRGARECRAFGAVNGGLGVKEIRHDAALRESVREHLERERPLLGVEQPMRILVAVRQALGLGIAEPARELRSQAPELQSTAREREDTLLAVAGLVPFVLRMLLQDAREHLLGLWHDRVEGTAAVPAGSSAWAQPSPQRAFTHLALAKPGRFRRAALRRALAFFAMLVGEGALQASSLGVHCLRFVLLEDGRLLFTDQQDGSLASRLFGLGRRARALLALVWSGTQGFPRSLFRHLCGATDHERLLEWLRTRELAAAFTYSAYPTLTARDVLVNAEIRRLLTAEPTDAGARRLLELV